MDAETVAAAVSLEKDFQGRLARDARLDPVINARMGGRRCGDVHGYKVGRAALMNAVRSEGAEVLGKDADGYWRDMARRYPHLRTGRETSGRRATAVFKDGVWWCRRGGRWVQEAPVRRCWDEDEGGV